MGAVGLQQFGDESTLLIRVPAPAQAAQTQQVVSTVRGALESKGCYVLSVTQPGPLVAQAHAEALFAGPESFPVARRLPKQGLGLGLAPSREILRRCDGDLVYRTRPTRFVLSLRER